MQRVTKCSALFLILALIPGVTSHASGTLQGNSQEVRARSAGIRSEEHYAVRDGLRIYLWEKHKTVREGTFAASGKVALLVHGGTWSGRPDFDLQIRD